MLHWGRRRRERIEVARAATAKSERLAVVVEHLRVEAQAIGEWAQTRYDANHLTDLFHGGRR